MSDHKESILASRSLKMLAVGCALVNVGCSIWVAHLEGNHKPTAYGIGAAFSPFFIILILQIFKACRNQRSRYQIYCYVTMLLLIGNVLSITQSLSSKTSLIRQNTSDKKTYVETFVYNFQSQLPYNVKETGYIITRAVTNARDNIEFNIETPLLKSDFEEGGIDLFLTEQKNRSSQNYCTNDSLSWAREWDVTFTTFFYGLDGKLIGASSVNSKDCI
jgi:hypothetical protein